MLCYAGETLSLKKSSDDAEFFCETLQAHEGDSGFLSLIVDKNSDYIIY